MKASDLPVRKVSVFGYGLIIPKDTICLVHFTYEIDRNSESGNASLGWMTFRVTVELRHTHFGREGRNRFEWKVQATTEDTPWLKRVITRTKLNHSTSYFGTGILGSEAWKKVERKFQEQKIRDSILDMFLEGKVSSAPLTKHLPKMP